MPCNITNLINLDFATANDAGNWFSNESSAVTQQGDKIRLKATDSATFFRRAIGTLDATKDRIVLQSNLEVFRPQTSNDGEICAEFTLLSGNTVIDTFTLYEENLTNGERVSFFFDREYSYSNLSGQLFLRISIPQGQGNEILLSDLSVNNQNFCAEDVRTYFVLKDVFSNAFNAMSVGLRLREYKINNAETLTNAFFSEITNIGGTIDGWYFAKANIDGTNRVQEIARPTTFNIFERDLGLTFDTTNSFHGGKPTGTATGSDYGPGILNFGFDKPQVLNKNLVNQPGAFFIDIDYSQNLRIVFDVIINLNTTSLFDRPVIYRTYYIEVDTASCTQNFYYLDQLNNNARSDESVNGFLSGLTSGVSSQEFVGCGDVLSYSGKGGTTEFQIDLGSNTGQAGLNYETTGVPANFVIEWNSQTFQTGFVGPNSFDQELINSGVLPSDIRTTSPSNGTGQLRFNKNLASPQIATIRVISPLDNTDWEITTVCPPSTGSAPSAQIGIGNCSVEPTESQNIFVDTNDIQSYTPSNGDVLYTDASLTNPFNGNNRIYRFRTDLNSIWKQTQFLVSATGVVSASSMCQVGNNVIILNDVRINNCQTVFVVTVVVSSGSSYRVQFERMFERPARLSTSTELIPQTINVNSDIDEVLTSNKTYVFGIDADNTRTFNEILNSSVVINVLDSSDNSLIETETFGRLHNNGICFI